MKSKIYIFLAVLALLCACSKTTPVDNGNKSDDGTIDVSQYRKAIFGYWGLAEETHYWGGEIYEGETYPQPYETVYNFINERDMIVYSLNKDYDEGQKRCTRYEQNITTYYLNGTSLILGFTSKIVYFSQDYLIFEYYDSWDGKEEILQYHLKRCDPVNTTDKY